MARISIPELVHEGFFILSESSKSEIDNLLSVLNNIRPDEELDEIDTKVSRVYGKNSRLILQTIVSFSELLEKYDNDVEKLSDSLASSFNDTQIKKIKENKLEVLQNNLREILTNIEALKFNLNTRRKALDNECILKSSELITDIRIIFGKDLNEKSKNAVILHKLHIEFYKNFEDNEMYMSLDIKELNKLKFEIDKAIEKEQILREEFRENLNFLY